MVFFEPYGQILYTLVAEKKYIDVKKIIQRTNNKLYVLIFIVSIIAIIVYPYVLELVIKKYYGTEILFFVLVISSVLLSINNMYIYYMVSNNFHFVLLKYQAIVLALNLLLNGIFVFFHMDILYYSYSTILSLLIYFILVRRFYNFDISNKTRLSII